MRTSRCARPRWTCCTRAHHDRVLADGTTLFSKPSGWKELRREKIVIPAALAGGRAPWYWHCVPVW